MFYKIGFFVLLAITAAMVWIFINVNPMKNTGSPSWIDIVSKSPEQTIIFMQNVFGTEIVRNKTKTVDAAAHDYQIVRAHGQIWPFAGVMEVPDNEMVPQSMIYLTVRDYDSAHEKMLENGAKPVLLDKKAAGMRFGIYIIPCGIHLGIAEWDSRHQN